MFITFASKSNKNVKNCEFCGLPIKVGKKSSSKYCRSRCKQSAYYRRKIIPVLNLVKVNCLVCNQVNENPEYTVIKQGDLMLKKYTCQNCQTNNFVEA